MTQTPRFFLPKKSPFMQHSEELQFEFDDILIKIPAHLLEKYPCLQKFQNMCKSGETTPDCMSLQSLHAFTGLLEHDFSSIDPNQLPDRYICFDRTDLDLGTITQVLSM